MKKIMIVSSMADIQARLTSMLESDQIPKADYSIFVELYKEGATGTDRYFSNVFTFDDMRNREAIEEGIEMFKGCGSFDQIIAADEYSVTLAAEVRERLGVPGNRVEDVIRFRDKVSMKEHLFGTDIATPEVYSIEQVLADPQLLPVVVKPRSYAGSIGVKIIRTKDDLSKLALQMKSTTKEFKEFSTESLELESFIEGAIFHIDGLVMNGEIIFCTASEYIGTCLEFIQGKKLGSISVAKEEELNAWTAFASRVHELMKFPDGAFHLESFMTPKGEKVFLEVGIRPGGSYIVPAIKAGTGVDLEVGHLQCQLNIEPHIPHPPYDHFGWAVFPKEPISVPSKRVRATFLPSFEGLIEPSWYLLPEKGEAFTGEFYTYQSNLGAFVFHGTQNVDVENSVRHTLNTYKVEAYQE